MTRPLLAALLLVAASTNVAFALCKFTVNEGTSANKRWKVVPTTDSTFTLFAWIDSTRSFVKKSEGKVDLPGHHVRTLVADSGEFFVLHDSYDGVSIHTSDGKLVKKLAPEDLLTKAELDRRPLHSSCHAEGEWSWEANPNPLPPVIAADSKSVRLGVYTARTIDVELATGKVLRVNPADDGLFRAAGTCSTPGDKAAHEWTRVQSLNCRRCRQQNKAGGRDWYLCEPCATAISACTVCGKKVEKK